MEMKFDIEVNAVIKGAVAEGKNIEECKDNLRKMTIEELLEYGYIDDFDIISVDGKIASASYNVEVWNIEYDDEDEDDFILPNELSLTISVDFPEGESEDSIIEDSISDEIFSTTGAEAYRFDYKVLSVN